MLRTVPVERLEPQDEASLNLSPVTGVDQYGAELGIRGEIPDLGMGLDL